MSKVSTSALRMNKHNFKEQKGHEMLPFPVL